MFFPVREGIRFVGLSTVSWHQGQRIGIQFRGYLKRWDDESIYWRLFLMIFVCAFNYVVFSCWWKLCLCYPFRSSNMTLDLSRIEWVLFLRAWLCFSGVHTNFTLSSLMVLCFASIHSLHKVHLAHNDGLSCLNAGLYQGCHAVSQLVYTVYTIWWYMMILLCWNSIFNVVQ